ncbi:MAG: hypothetical protein GYB33_11255 [Gammaproteobacteria bacterium]|nr:hypothetical protein [Gammaproteobacteria bacterium]
MTRWNMATAAIVVLVVVPGLIYLGYRFVPGVRAPGSGLVSDEFFFNGYLIFLGFFLTSAVIGPIVAQFVEWRSTAEWASARRNAMHRFWESLNDALGKYETFLQLQTRKETEHHAALFLDQTVAALDSFFEMYAAEQVAFNPGMHSSASNIRNILLPLQKSLASTRLMASRSRSYRAYFHPDALDKFRALFELEPLSDSSRLASDSFFSSYGKVFVDLSLDQQLGAGSISIHSFKPVDIAAIQNEWLAFCRACGEKPEQVRTLKALKGDGDTQVRLHTKFVRAHIEEDYLASPLLYDDAR